ncbi:MAG: HDOD domain-containing protein [Desulfarculaceae bacterium]|nr:HDOD domain-containing protein [Desulfarculaceae bacterium]
MNSFVARQPILDEKERTVAYEILFRNGIENEFPDVEGDKATFRIIADTFLASGFKEVTGGKKAFINFPENLIVNMAPRFLPSEQIVVEVLENVTPTKEVLESIRRLKKDGYTIVLDDFMFLEGLEPLVEAASMIKVDFKLLSVTEIQAMLERLKLYSGLKFLAEKIETYDQFEQARELGFSYFQGFFFARPRLLKSRTIPISENNLFRMISEVSKENVDFSKVTSVIQNDVAVSLRLLRLVNSAYYRRMSRIDSVRDAVVMLGQDRIKRFVMMLFAADIAEGKADELIKVSISRARMAEEAGALLNIKFSRDELFTLGLFSNVDAMLGIRMEDLVTQLPFSEKINNALLRKNTAFSNLLFIIKLFERGFLKKAHHFCTRLKVKEEEMLDIYLDSLKMADNFVNTFH